MKYIRTKDGIIDFDKYELDYEHWDFYILKSKKHRKNGQDYTKLNKECIIKQADNIKELCDDFIVCHPEVNGGLPFILPKRDGLLENEFKLAVYCKTFPYGAIWTDKGLIYVAQLNDKGEWGLL